MITARRELGKAVITVGIGLGARKFLAATASSGAFHSPPHRCGIGGLHRGIYGLQADGDASNASFTTFGLVVAILIAIGMATNDHRLCKTGVQIRHKRIGGHRKDRRPTDKRQIRATGITIDGVIVPLFTDGRHKGGRTDKFKIIVPRGWRRKAITSIQLGHGGQHNRMRDGDSTSNQAIHPTRDRAIEGHGDPLQRRLVGRLQTVAILIIPDTTVKERHCRQRGRRSSR